MMITNVCPTEDLKDGVALVVLVVDVACPKATKSPKSTPKTCAE